MPNYIINYSGYGSIYVEDMEDAEAARDVLRFELPDGFKTQEVDVEEA